MKFNARLEEIHKGQDVRNTLILFPYGGGSPIDFREWKSPLLHRFRVLAVQYSGHGAGYGAPLAQSMPELLKSLISHIRGAMTEETVFFGHSLGAITAYEMSLHLSKEGRQPRHLFVSGISAPHLPKRNAPVHHLPDPQFDKELLGYGGLPEVVTKDPALMDFVRPLQRAAFRIWETYEHAPSHELSCPITAFAGMGDHYYPEEDVRPWSEHTSGPFQFHAMPGGHIYVHENKERIMTLLAKAGC